MISGRGAKRKKVANTFEKDSISSAIMGHFKKEAILNILILVAIILLGLIGAIILRFLK